MENTILVTLISGVFSVASALGAVFLKDYLDKRPAQTADDLQIQSEPQSLQDSMMPVKTGRPARIVATSWARPAGIVLASFVFGIATRALRPLLEYGGVQYEAYGALILLILASGWLAIFHRRKGLQILYQLEILALWAGWASGWSLMHGSVWDDLLAVTIPWWLGCGFVGGLIVSFRNPTRAMRNL